MRACVARLDRDFGHQTLPIAVILRVALQQHRTPVDRIEPIADGQRLVQILFDKKGSFAEGGEILR